MYNIHSLKTQTRFDEVCSWGDIPPSHLAPGWVQLWFQIKVEPYKPNGPENVTLWKMTIAYQNEQEENNGAIIVLWHKTSDINA